MGVKVVVFDLDDTLYLERDYVRSGFRAVSRYLTSTFGTSNFDKTAWDYFLAGRRGNIFDLALAEAFGHPDPQLVASCVQIYRQHRPNISLLADAISFIDQLIGRVELGLITDGPRLSQRAKVDALGLEPLLEHIVVTDERGKDWSKPSTKAFTHIEQVCHHTGESCVYIADNPRKDFAAPHARGWKTIRVRRGPGLYASYPSTEDVDVEIPDLSAMSLAAGGIDLVDIESAG